MDLCSRDSYLKTTTNTELSGDFSHKLTSLLNQSFLGIFLASSPPSKPFEVPGLVPLGLRTTNGIKRASKT